VRGGGDGCEGSNGPFSGWGLDITVYLIVTHRRTYLPTYRHKMGGGFGGEAKHGPARNEWGGLGYRGGTDGTGKRWSIIPLARRWESIIDI
jgi:hypothetical protein